MKMNIPPSIPSNTLNAPQSTKPQNITMPPIRTPRRSARLASQQKHVPNLKLSHTQKQRSPTQYSKEKYLESWLRDGSYSLSSLISDGVSDSDIDSEDEWDEEGSDSESGELFDLSSDTIEYQAALDISRRQSYDSRYERRNEEYEYDDFVVADDASTEIGVGGVSTVAGDEDKDESPSLSIPGCRLAYRPNQEDRKTSTTTSRSSNLFVSEYPSKRRRSSLWKVEAVVSGASHVVALDSAEEVVEEIMDAIALFSRRCNRNRPPVCISLSAKALEDVEVRNVLEDAKGMGCAQLVEERMGTETWTVGPPKSGWEPM
ncbi:hypothetical protein P154DRAFT_517905 [Amniculicola lignicola CBS 123094]|uniref:Uncharacterized protein n=1 Tax=Amniculicola lignicola CBS 123094 TaxID=1392246 RepID=A0A6A5WYL7_9PLEO|nr:hypothetical protein P154DRAFT_517905 [Amniculicola lignicola CBS 123094]